MNKAIRNSDYYLATNEDIGCIALPRSEHAIGTFNIYGITYTIVTGIRLNGYNVDLAIGEEWHPSHFQFIKPETLTKLEKLIYNVK